MERLVDGSGIRRRECRDAPDAKQSPFEANKLHALTMGFPYLSSATERTRRKFACMVLESRGENIRRGLILFCDVH